MANMKRALALGLACAMVATSVPANVQNVEAAAKKQPTAATKMTFSKKSVSVKEGAKSGAVKITLNKKATKKVTINVKSNSTAIAKVSKAKVTVKKGKKASATFTVTGVKAGSTKVKASFKNKKGKTITKTFTVTVTAAAKPTTTPTTTPVQTNLTGVTLSNTTPKVGATITAKTTPSNVAGVTYEWFVDGKSAGTGANFTIPAGSEGKTIKVVAKANGQTVESPVATISSASAQLIDKNGLQADGTAILGDTLQVTYTADLGNPKQVTIYRDGSALSAGTANGGNMSFSFKVNAEGNYFAVITNEKDEKFTSNTIKATKDEIKADLHNVTFTEDYETPRVKTATSTNQYIMTASLNKDYEGNFVIFKEKETEYKAGDDKSGLTGDGAAEYSTDDCTGNEVVTNPSSFTDKKCTSELKYVNPDTGETTYKFVIDQDALTRGDKFQVVFDQKNIEDDNVKATKNENVNAFKDVVAPYVTAPDKIVVEDKKTSTEDAGWSAQLYTGEEKAEWIKSATDTESVVKIDLYSNKSSNTNDGTKFSDGGGTDTDTIYKGKAVDAYTTAASGDTVTDSLAATQNFTPDHTYVYAKFEAVKGVFGADKLELTSATAQVPDAVATKVTLKESTDDARDMIAEFENVKGSGTAYLVTADWDTNENKTAEAAVKKFNDDETEYVAKATVAKGAAKVTFEDALDKVSNKTKTEGDVYAIVVVPDNDNDYAKLETKTLATGAVRIRQDETTYVLEKKSGLTSSNKATIKVKDQFGDEIEQPTAIGASGSEKTMTAAAKNTGTASAHKMYMTNSGELNIVSGAVSSSTTDKVNDEFYIAVNGKQNIHVKVTHVNANSVADEWEAWID